MTHSEDALAAVLARARTRSRLRAATVTAGIAGLATAGVIAYHLPSQAHHKALTNTAVAPARTTAPATIAHSHGDDGGGGSATAAGGKGTGTTSHATSGGS